MNRLIALGLLSTVTLPSVGAARDQAAPAPADVGYEARTLFGLESYSLWPGRAPLAADDTPGETPTLTVFRPVTGTGNGTAILIAPGGAYMTLAGSHEGSQVASWFASRGVTAFVLRYRVGPRARLPIPMLDGKRAMRFLRAHAARFSIAADRIGMLGFSAGGHLAATVAAESDAGVATSPDLVERAPDRPDFLVLGYPWLRATAIAASGASAYCTYTGDATCDPHRFARFDPLRRITATFPPTFIFHTNDDPLVSPGGSVALYQMLTARRIPVELHVFASGPHGVGMGGADPALSRWPTLMEQWLNANGLLSSKVK